MLIARGEHISSVISAPMAKTRTAAAADVVAWPVVADVPIRVVTVADVDLKKTNEGDTRCDRVAKQKAARLAGSGARTRSNHVEESPTENVTFSPCAWQAGGGLSASNRWRS